MAKPTVSDRYTTLTPDLVTDYGYARRSRSIIHELIGRADPDVTLRPASTRNGTLSYFAVSRELAYELELMHVAGDIFTVDTDPDDPTAVAFQYVLDGDLRVEYDAENDKWMTRVGFREVIL